MRYEIGQIPTEEVTMRSEKKTTLKSKNCLGKSSNED